MGRGRGMSGASEDFAKYRALWEYIWVVRKDNQAFETWSGVTEIGTLCNGFIMGIPIPPFQETSKLVMFAFGGS